MTKNTDTFPGWVLYSTVPPEEDLDNMPNDYDPESEKEKQQPTQMTKIGGFNTFDKFWEVYGSVISPSAIWGRGGFYYMKKGVKPIPNDPKHSGGISYTLYYPCLCHEDEESRKIEVKFLNVIFSVMKRLFPKADTITAIIFESTKERTSISVWTPPLKAEDAALFEANLKVVFGKNTVFTKKKLIL